MDQSQHGRRRPCLSRALHAARSLHEGVTRTAALIHNLFDNRVLWTHCEKVQVGVMLRGGVGDVMIAARWLHNVIPALAANADIVIDIYYALPENITFIFGKFDRVRYLYRDVAFEYVRRYYNFSFVINHLGYVEIDFANMQDEFAKLPFASAIEPWLAGVERFSPFTTRDYHPDLGKNFYSLIEQSRFKRHSILEAQTGSPAPVSPFPFLLPEGDRLSAFPQLRNKYITVHDGWDAQLKMGDRRPTKAYPHEKWSALIAALKNRFPELAVVQLGGKTGAPIPGVDLNLRNGIGFGASASVLKNALLHIDTDSGLVHVAASLGTRSIVLFGPTDIGYYGYPSNINLNVEGCNNCWLRTGNWIIACMIGDPIPTCMNNIDVESIIRSVDSLLAGDSCAAPAAKVEFV